MTLLLHEHDPYVNPPTIKIVVRELGLATRRGIKYIVRRAK